MLTEKVMEDAKKGFALQQYEAPCYCCGQFITIRCQDYLSDSEKRELATECCRCENARRFTNIKRSNENIDKAFEQIFKESDTPDELEESLKETARAVLRGNLLKVKVEIPEKARDEPKRVLTISEKDGILKINISQKLSQDIKI